MMPSCDSFCPLARAWAWVSCPTRRVPFFITTLPSCLTSSAVRASTWSPGLLRFASRAVASVALILEPLERFVELLAALLFAEVEDDVAAEPLPEACAPDLFACTAVWD